MYIDTTIYITAEWTNNVCMIQTYITRHMMYINASLRGFGTQLWVLNTKVCVCLVNSLYKFDISGLGVCDLAGLFYGLIINQVDAHLCV